MNDERHPEESADQVEDLDVPADACEDVKGGVKDGASNTLMKGCATGKHLPEATITH